MWLLTIRAQRLRLPMAQAKSANRPLSAPKVSPLFFFTCAIVLALGGTLFYWLEKDPAVIQPTVADEAAAAQAASARALQRLREREAKARTEMERKEAEERAQRAAVMASGAAEAAAKKEREEIALRTAESAKAQRSATETEEAWKRFYKPSSECRDPAASTRVECVNEFVKAKREFQASLVARPN